MRLPFDEYEIRARLFPALIVTLPVIVCAYCLFPGVRTVRGATTGALVEASVLFLLAKVARDQGKRIEARLYLAWEGKPTTAMLRHSDARLDPLTKERYKLVLSKISGITFPTTEQEAMDKEGSDIVYASAVKALIERRRTKSYRLLFLENCNFGFMRNLYGLRGLGYALAVATLILDFGIFCFQRARTNDSEWLSIAVSCLTLILLFMYATEAAVKRTAEAYAEALLRTCEEPRGSAKPKKPS